MRKSSVLAVRAAVVSMLPVLGCPFCWPGYAALLSSLGLGFLASARYQVPLTIALLIVPVAGLRLQALRQGAAPLVLGAIASGLSAEYFGISLPSINWARSATSILPPALFLDGPRVRAFSRSKILDGSPIENLHA